MSDKTKDAAVINLADRKKQQEVPDKRYQFLPYEYGPDDLATIHGEFGEPFKGEDMLIACLLDRQEGMGIVTSIEEARKLIIGLGKAIEEIEMSRRKKAKKPDTIPENSGIFKMDP